MVKHFSYNTPSLLPSFKGEIPDSWAETLSWFLRPKPIQHFLYVDSDKPIRSIQVDFYTNDEWCFPNSFVENWLNNQVISLPHSSHNAESNETPQRLSLIKPQ